MFQIDHSSRKPIYEQVCEQTMLMISTDLLSAGDKMPSVRYLSVQLGVNPNTIARAYTDLCNNKILYSVGGKGCFVADNAKKAIYEKANSNLGEFRTCVEKMRMSGVDKDILKQEIDAIFNNGGLSND